MQILIMGDFNLPCITWTDITINTGFKRVMTDCAKKLLSFMEHNFMSQYVDVPTRKRNILDLLISNSENLILHVNSEKTKLSDHNIVNITTQYPINTKPTSQMPAFENHTFRALNLHKADFSQINTDLHSVDWDELRGSCSTPSEFPELLISTTLQICEKHTPAKKQPNKPTNKHTRSRRTLKRNIKNRQFQLDMTKALTPERTRTIEKLNKEINEAHLKIQESIECQQREAELRAIQTIKTNPRYFHSYAKKFAKRKTNIGPLLDSDNNLQQEPKKMADLLQEQYSSVFSDPKSSKKRSPRIDITHQEILDDITFTEEDIKKAIDEIGTYSACGENDIPAIVLKNCKEELSYPIWKIWRESLDTGEIPSQFKFQLITPVHKKGSKALPSNYRPISLTSHLIKIFERVLRTKLVAYLERNKILCKNQHGFRKGRSCLTQLIYHIDHNFLSGNDTDSIYLDYAKAFDKVDHSLLLEKIHAYGIRGKLFAWLTMYLQNRTQTVTINGAKSDPASVKSGVPQGTVLGPVLFILYLNDLTKCIKHSVISSFADDTRLQKEIKTIQDVVLLQEDLNASVCWSEENNMALHTNKFEYLCHSTGSSKLLQELPFSSQFYQYTTEEADITPTNIVRDLGINIVPDLQWSPHINIICDNAKRITAWILSVFKDRSTDTMLTLYKSLIRSRLEYCCPIWDPTKIQDIVTLEGIQRSFTSKIVSVAHLDYHDRLKELKMMSLQRRRERYSIITIFKMLNNIAPNDLGITFYTSDRRGIRVKIPSITRDAKMKYITQYDDSFKIRAAKLWNSIPADLTTRTSMETFKPGLTRYLQNIPDRPPIQGLASSNSILAYQRGPCRSLEG